MCYCNRAWHGVIPPPPCPYHSQPAPLGHIWPYRHWVQPSTKTTITITTG